LKRLLVTLTLVVFLIAIVPIPIASKGPPIVPVGKPFNITILHTNDIHGRLENVIKGDNGIARIATLVEQIRDEAALEGRFVLLLDAGDATHGTLLANYFEGKPVIDVMNTMGYDAMEIGNHDFNYGQAGLAERAAQANFPLLCANVVETATGMVPSYLTPYVIKEVGGRRIAIFGLITPETPWVTHPKNVVGLTFLDPIETAKQLVPKLRPKADVIIALTHIGYPMDRNLAENVEGISVIVGGHSHTKIVTPENIGDTIIVQAWEYGKVLGRLDLTLSVQSLPDTHDQRWHRWHRSAVTSFSGELIPNTTSIPRDPAVQGIIDNYLAILGTEMSRVVGRTLVDLDGRRWSAPIPGLQGIRREEKNVGNLVADMMRWASEGEAQIAFNNGGGIRWHKLFPAGDITYKDVYELLPFTNTLVMMDLTGSQIRQALENSVKNTHLQGAASEFGGFLQISGMTFEYDNSLPMGSRVVEVLVGGVPLDDAAVYRVATNDFLAAGGDGYTVLTGGTNFVNTGRYLLEYMVEYLQEFSPISPAVEGRIVQVS